MYERRCYRLTFQVKYFHSSVATRGHSGPVYLHLISLIQLFLYSCTYRADYCATNTLLSSAGANRISQVVEQRCHYVCHLYAVHIYVSTHNYTHAQLAQIGFRSQEAMQVTWYMATKAGS